MAATLAAALKREPSRSARVILAADRLQGTGSITNTVISGSIEHNVQFYNQSGSMNLTISGSTIKSNSVAFGSDGLQVEMQGTATASIAVTGSTFTENKSQAIQVAANDNSQITLTISGNTITRGSQGNEGIVLSNGSNGDLTFDVDNNTITGFGGVGIFAGQTPGNATASSNLIGKIRNNTITSPSTATNHSMFIAFTSTVGQVAPANILIDNNTVTQNSTSGTARGILVDTPDSSTSPSFTATVINN